MSSSIPASRNDNEKGRLYGYEIPPLEPGGYEIITEQIVSADKNETQTLYSTQAITVETVPPYSPIPSNLISSFYPPSLSLVSPLTLPHVVLKGAVAWERSSASAAVDDAPTPWLALLLFTESELSAPAELLVPGVKPSGTKALTLPLDAVNKNYANFCLTKPLDAPEKSVSGASDATQATADFIFVDRSAFRAYFEQQDASKKSQTQAKADLDRYKFLALMTDTGLDDGTGHANAKLSTLMGHRTRPYGSSDKEEKVIAHVVSIEQLDARVDWAAVTKPDSSTASSVAMVSLFSWSYTWDSYHATEKLDMFKHLGRPESTRALAIPIPADLKDDTAAMPWVKRRLSEGYTITRHRDMAGEVSMALYRGPLTPRPTRRAHLRPSIHGTDLQIIDTTAQILDLSYSTAWELGRSLAGRDAKFSTAMAGLRRKLCMHAITEAKGSPASDQKTATAKAMHTSKHVMDSVLSRLDKLFEEPLASRIKGLPLNGPNDKATRWQVPRPKTTSIASSPAAMTQAKLRRYLKDFAKEWITKVTISYCESPSQECEVPQLPIVFNWIVANLMSLKLVPSVYLFPDPAALVDESINCFLVDDAWVDAMVDGAMSLANTMGGTDDPVRELIRTAFNKFLEKAPLKMVSIGGSGFVLKSGVVESFPDLEIEVKAAKSKEPLICPLRAKNENMIMCLVGRDAERKLVDYEVKLKLPPHQQRFAMDSVAEKSLKFIFELAPYLPSGSPGSASEDLEDSGALSKAVTWSSDGKLIDPTMEPVSAPWSWTTGVLVPQTIAEMTDKFVHEAPKEFSLCPIAKDSRSLYLATQLTDRDHSILVDFNVTKGQGELTPREIYPKHLATEPDTRDEAPVHVPVANNQGVTSQAASSPVGKSYFTKQAFSQDFPGETIPAESNTTQNLIFAIKVSETGDQPSPAEIVSIDVTIPLGEDPSDLLDHLAPMPSVRTLGSRQQWISGLTRRKRTVRADLSATGGEERVLEELVVHLRTRGGGSAALKPGLDASFMLMRATVNGVMGDDVEIRVEETYVYKSLGGTAGVETVQNGDKEVKVLDSWFVTKE